MPLATSNGRIIAPSIIFRLAFKQSRGKLYHVLQLNFSDPLCIFKSLMKLFKVDPADCMISICGNDALRELSSPGKRGSFFYLAYDDHYMIKTIKKS